MRRSVAQLAERRSPKPKAVGSRPSTPANLSGGATRQEAKIGMIKKLIEFGQQVNREIRKITWPTQKEIGVTTLLIFIMATCAAIFFFFVDYGVSKLIRLILGVHG
jgi:preprotein translocase subunit SecE